ncbi:MAG: L,D-transpeptidase [Deltaproteobacteria bacterium]|nr:L,D-transpeptidase [Deltaproteobacteria bacterium]MBI2341378.1 L,D-transpeptidase [Deltaproteobacteria bacterium]
MKLSSLFIVTFGIWVISYPLVSNPHGYPYFAESKKQAEPAPRPDSPRSDFALNEYRIIINIPETKLYLYENEAVVMTLPVAVGQAIYKTPVGHDELRELIWNPWWYPPKSEWAKDEKITPPGPKNPLGPVKMVLGDEIRLHGTTKDSSIGRAASHGCVRLHSEDAVTLAWYLQSHLTGKSDSSYLEKYKKAGSSTFHVKLDRPVSVDLIYNIVAFNEDELTVYPDFYNKISKVSEVASWELFSNGISPWELNLASVFEPIKSAVKINVEDLM